MKLLIPLLGILIGTGCMLRSTPIMNTVDVSDVDWSNVSEMKHAASCATYLFGVFPVGGTTSIVRAVEKAEVTKITSVAARYKNWIIISQSCVEVWGE